MPFALPNALATFQNVMNEIFKHMIDHGVVIYLDDILIYSRSEEDHIALTKKVWSAYKNTNWPCRRRSANGTRLKSISLAISFLKMLLRWTKTRLGLC